MIVVLALAAGLALAWPSRPGFWPPTRSLGTGRQRPQRGGSGWDRRLPVIGVAAVLTIAASPPLGLAVLAAVVARPRLASRRAAARRRWAVIDAVPEAADLLALAVAGGLTVPLALAAAARWSPPPVGDALERAGAELGLGRPTADILEDLAESLGAPARPLVDVLLASERYGVPLGDSLDRVAREARLERRRRGEERARRVPVLLLFPLVLCVLPAFGFLTVVPLLVGSLPDLPP
ncbi:MAG TPA: type II secretion system F family protein [Acidimicrobiales bacterium]